MFATACIVDVSRRPGFVSSVSFGAIAPLYTYPYLMMRGPAGRPRDTLDTKSFRHRHSDDT
jgi:hypothetical protein